MSLAKTEFVLLCEDRQQQNFVYHYLLTRGVNPRRIRKLPLPAGTQAGEQYVRQEFHRQVLAHRRRDGAVTTALVTVIDADTEPLERRLQQLDEALRTQGAAPRAEGERLPVLIPRRNIETWIHDPGQHAVDEMTDYKPKTSAECKLTAQALHAWCQAPVPTDAPPSLVHARLELKRLT